MKKKQSIFLICFVVLVLSGCNNRKIEPEVESEVKTETKTEDEKEEVAAESITLKKVSLEETKKEEYTYSVKEFDVGAGTYVSPAGKEMPYHIDGIMGVPEGEGPFPLVLITHGSHSNDDETLRFDTGFRYLVETLTKQGLVVVSMDMSKPYIWKYGDNDDREKSQYLAMEHLNRLIQANKGESETYPMNLTGKIDFSKIALIGHSRGGETIFDIAEDMKNRELSVEALLCIAPTYQFTDRTWPEADVALLIPEYDGDVTGLDGFSLYDVLNEKTKGKHLAVYLKGANHNFFNQNIEKDDSTRSVITQEYGNPLTREEQEEFLQAFASDFLFNTLQSDSELISLESMQPDVMYGKKVALLYKNSKSIPICSIEENSAYTSKNLNAELKTDAWFYQKDELAADTVTTGEETQSSRKLLKILWEENPASIQFTSSIADWSDYQSMRINFVVDPSDERNKGIDYQSFFVRVTDLQGKVVTVKLPEELQAMMVPKGELGTTELGEETLYYWSILTPISSVFFPISSFKGVNIEEIKSVELVFDAEKSGSVLLESIEIQ